MSLKTLSTAFATASILATILTAGVISNLPA